MKTEELAARMRRGECYHELRVPPGAYTVVRVDGRSFSRLTERIAKKPFDEAFHGHMVHVARGLLEALSAVYVHTHSDEVSALLPRESDLFDREVEKLVSIAAGRASAVMSLRCNEVVELDARLWVGATDDDVVDYFAWRQADGARCSLHGIAYWALRAEGKSAREATKALEGASVAAKHDLLHARGINFNHTPAWQRRGTALYHETYTREGRDPRTGEPRLATRRRIRQDDALPMKQAYAAYVRERLAGAAA